MLSVFITPWMKPTSIHWAIERRLRLDDAPRRTRGTGSRPRRLRVVAGDRVVGEPPHERPGRRSRAAYWNVPTRMWLAATRASTAPGSSVSRATSLARRDDGERPRRGDAERVHRLADHVLAQHRPDGRLAVAAARERRAPRALQVQVAAAAVDVDDLAEQQRAAVAQPRRVAAELVAGVGLRDRRRALGRRRCRPGRRRRRRRAAPRRRRPSSAASVLVERQQPRLGDRRGLPRHVEPLELAREGVVEGEQGRAATRMSSRLASDPVPVRWRCRRRRRPARGRGRRSWRRCG